MQLRPFRDYLDSRAAFIGAPEDVASGLQEYLEATGYLRVMLLMAIPGLGTDAALRSMRLFVDEVAPALGSVART